MRLQWRNDHVVAPERFRGWMVQTERVRDEPVWYEIVGLSYAEREMYAATPLELGAYGRGGKTRVKAAAQILADMITEAER